MSLKIGLVGCGAIGFEIARSIDRGDIPADLVAICDRNPMRVKALLSELKSKPLNMGLKDLVLISDLVVEAASQGAVPSVAKAALLHGCDLMLMSVGALMDPNLFKEIQDLAAANGAHVYIPSGAIGGLDGLKSAGMGRIDSVRLTTTKNPRGLAGAPYILEKGIDLTALTEPTTIFEGPASEAVKAFPANVNVAATLSLACGGNVMVRIIADPNAVVNMHEIVAEGEFGKMTTRVENVPSPSNPKTSYLAALSAVATLRLIATPIKIGT